MIIRITEEKQEKFLNHGYNPTSEEEFTLLTRLDFVASWETVEYETNTRILVFKSDDKVVSFSVFDVLKASESEWTTWKLLNHQQSCSFGNLLRNNYGEKAASDVLSMLNWKED